MNDKDKSDPGTESSWELGSHWDSFYFFGSDRDSSLLSEFGWNLHPEESDRNRNCNNARFSYLEDDGSGLAASSVLREDESGFPDSGSVVVIGSVEKTGGLDASTSNPSVSSSSSEDVPVKSASSGVNPPPETTSKVRKKVQKRIQQQRFAFMTKSEVDNLEDGYRWRKYGQKAVKNSPFPRSYYRCTNSKCTVKKRVERSYEDSTTVITTYEGQHCHHIVGFPRGGRSVINHEAVICPQLASPTSQYYSPAVQFSPESSLSITQQSNQVPEVATEFHALPQPQPQPQQRPQLPTDEGLLDDIVSPRMCNR